MNKFGLILDSASGFTEKELNKKGHGFIPLQIIINDKSFKAGIDKVADDIYKVMSDKSVNIKTSSPLGEDIEKAFDYILKNNEKAIYISISHKMSGTNNAARMISETDKYKGKIFVYESEYSSPWLNVYLNCFEKLLKEESDIKKIFKILDLANPFMKAQISPGNIYWFYKGGRITKVQYFAGSLLKLNPILTISNGEINKKNVEKIRGVNKSMKKISSNFVKIIENLNLQKEKYKIMVMKSNIDEYTNDMEEIVHNDLKIPKNKILKQNVSPEQICHMGPGSFGMGLFIKLIDLQKMKKEGKI